MSTQTVSRSADLNFQYLGSIVMCEALTEAGREWLQRFTCSEPWQWMGNALAIEPRCVEPICEGALDDGLEVL